MNRPSVFFAIGIAAMAATTKAANVDLSKMPAAAAKTGLTFDADIKPILEASCFRCHGEERHKGDLRLDSLAAVLKGGEDGKVVIPGKSLESTLLISVSQLDDENAMPPKPKPGGRGGPGGPGGRGGFGPGMFIGPQMITEGDKNGDKALSKAEFAGLADAWFDKLDPDKAGKLSQDQFSERFGPLLPERPGGRGPGGPGGPPGGGPGRFIGAGFFTATDTDKNGSVSKDEWKAAFARWFGDWDSDKSGSLDQKKVSEGLNAVLPPPNFGPGGPGGPPPGGRGPEGPGGGPGGSPAKPLTPEQVGLVRAWIDQGAK